jgi:F-type H+-transporting ATPase subunit delta
MNEIIAKRYARALIQIGQEDGQYEQYGRELKAFQEVLEASPELRAVMVNPIYEREDKKGLLGAIHKRLNLSQVVRNFLLLLVDKRRIGSFKDIVRCYEALADELAGRVTAKVASAVPLDEAILQELKKRLETMTGKQVFLQVQQEPELIGGVVTQIGDTVFDGSVRTQLAGIKETLLKG